MTLERVAHLRDISRTNPVLMECLDEIVRLRSELEYKTNITNKMWAALQAIGDYAELCPHESMASLSATFRSLRKEFNITKDTKP